MQTGSKHHANACRTSQVGDNTTERTFASVWRWSYARPAGVGSPGVEGAKALRGVLEAATTRSREWQAEQIRQTGFATPYPEIGHNVIAVLRSRGYAPTVAAVGGHLAAVGTAYNWQGNARLAQLIGRSERTVQRARATLEEDGLIRSYLLLTGDQLDGQRSPVRHPQVVRDVGKLQRLAHVRATMRHETAPARRRPRRPSAAETPQPPEPPQPQPSADDFERLGKVAPEFAAFFTDMAAAAAARHAPKPPPNAAPVTPADEIDAWDQQTERLEEQLERARERERGPPGRGPPN